MKKNSVNRKRSIKSITALLLSCLLLFQTNIASATTGTVSGNETAEEEVSVTVSENQPSEIEESEAGAESEEKPEDMEEEKATVSGQSLPEIQAGAVTGPANPVHHCTKENDGSDYTDFSYVYFGSYPQSEVTDSKLIAVIDEAIEKADVRMDVWVNGTKYRRISKDDTEHGRLFDNVPNNGYRYFKWERIKWKVLKNDGKTLFVVADKAIDCKRYNETMTSATWEASTIRNWLNTSFYNMAFSSSEQSAIATQNVVNEDNLEYATGGGNDTNDKLYLLSISEVTDAAYGFCSDSSPYSMSRRVKTSDYANARGTERSTGSRYEGNCSWWLRSHSDIQYYNASYVSSAGGAYRDGNNVITTSSGVCPALHINLSSGIYSITDDGTSGEEENEKTINPVHYCTRKDDGSDYTDFSYVYFGSYPQREVTDSKLIAVIDKTIEKYGILADVGMDVWVNGTKYRRISKDDINYDGRFDDVPNNGYRYFKWERIKWKVLKNDGKTLFVVADKAIDCKNYYDVSASVTWETSTIRNWLNTSFYHTAFCSKEQSVIAAQTVVNEDNSVYGTAGGNNTNDKVYLLSIGEVTDAEYGFCSDYSVESMSRRMKASDYANARGIWRDSEDNCRWWLRSPGCGSYFAADVDDFGFVYRDGLYVYKNSFGACPALHINLSSGIYSITDDGTSGEEENEKTANPTASIPTGSSVAKNTKITLSCATAGADIYYTTDGTMPTIESTLYTGGITIDRDMTVKAVAMCRGFRQSDVAEFSYKLNVKVQKLTIKAPSKKLAAGKKVKLTLNVTPKDAANKAVKWKTSNKKYATVDKNGKITLKKKGIGKEVTITATAQDGSGKKAAIKIKIMRHSVKSIKLTAPKKTLKAGKTMTIKATVKTTGKNANKSLKWTSSNKKYATVNSKGKVTAKKAGKGKTVTITAKSTDGSNKKAKVKIEIK